MGALARLLVLRQASIRHETIYLYYFLNLIDLSLLSKADLENAKGLAKALQLPNLCTLLSRRLGLSAGRLDASASLTNFIFANLQQLERTFTADVIITSQGDERVLSPFSFPSHPFVK